MASTPQVKKAKVLESVEVPAGTFVRLPNGSVVSTTGPYTFAHTGKHVVAGVEYDVQ